MNEHQTTVRYDDWITPEHVFVALGEHFDMDVATTAPTPRGGPYVPCDVGLTAGGLEADWTGFVWMNPPFGHQSTKRAWLAKFFAHGNGIALVPDRTSAPWWQEFAPLASAVCFVSPKIKFERPDGTRGEQPGTGTCLFGAGLRAKRALFGCGLGVTF